MPSHATPSQAVPNQAGDVPTFSAATVRATAAVQPSDIPVILPPSMHAFRPASPENEFPELLNFRGDEDVDEGDKQPPTTPRHPRINGAPLCPPSAQGCNPVTPAHGLGQTPGRSHTSQCRTQYQDGPTGSKKRHTADDVWKFFPLKNDRRECSLCE